MHKNILFAFFDGTATSLERRMLEDWLADPAHEAYFYQCLDEWQGKRPQYVPETERALGQFMKLLHEPLAVTPSLVEPEPPRRRTRSLRSWWAIAASVTLLLAGLFQQEIRYQRFATGSAQTRVLRLADGTRVILNANSSLSVPRWGFATGTREVLLTGEAEFTVTHTWDNRRFVVRTDDQFKVEVYGTEFIVFARERGKKVVLNKGSVRVNYRAGREVALRPGDVLTLDAQSGQPRIRQTTRPREHNAWKNHQFYFDNAPLAEVAQVIGEHFGVEVKMADSSLANRRLAGYFKATSPQEATTIISALLGLSIQQHDHPFFIQNP